MSAPDHLSGKIRITSTNPASQLKNSRPLPVHELIPQAAVVSKTSNSYRLGQFKEHQEGDQSQKSKIIPTHVSGRSKKYGIDNLYSGAGKLFSPSFANYKNVVSDMKLEATQPGDHRVDRDWTSNHVSELHDAVTDLQGVSDTINKRLDDTYYSILEKLSSLQRTITSLKDLASKTRQLNARLLSECHRVSYDTNKQLDCFESFQDQAMRIKQLKKRVDLGRQSFLCLIDRVKHVQKRVESWEIDERQWRKTSRKRMRIFWSFLIGILVLILILYIFSWWVTENIDGNSEIHPISIQVDGSQSNKKIVTGTKNLILKSKIKVPDQINIRCGSGVTENCQNPRELNEL